MRRSAQSPRARGRLRYGKMPAPQSLIGAVDAVVLDGNRGESLMTRTGPRGRAQQAVRGAPGSRSRRRLAPAFPGLDSGHDPGEPGHGGAALAEATCGLPADPPVPCRPSQAVAAIRIGSRPGGCGTDYQGPT